MESHVNAYEIFELSGIHPKKLLGGIYQRGSKAKVTKFTLMLLERVKDANLWNVMSTIMEFTNPQ